MASDYTATKKSLILQPLTKRETQVVQLLANGLRNREIAEALGLGVTTVHTHLYNIYEKMGCNTRTQAAIAALRLGLID